MSQGPMRYSPINQTRSAMRKKRLNNQKNVLVLIVTAQTNKHRQLVVLQVGMVVDQCIGMHKELHALILSEVEGCILVYSLRLAF